MSNVYTHKFSMLICRCIYSYINILNLVKVVLFMPFKINLQKCRRTCFYFRMLHSLNIYVHPKIHIQRDTLCIIIICVVGWVENYVPTGEQTIFSEIYLMFSKVFRWSCLRCGTQESEHFNEQHFQVQFSYAPYTGT